ncbi:MAG: aminopeptidase [Chromatiales bacterium]|nr:aminopeptidase [Chromatiales bacterium]
MRVGPARASRVALLVLALAATGCETIGYYAQSIRGHFALMARARPIDELLADDKTPADLRERLVFAKAVRQFASEALALPDNGSYTCYAQINRESVVYSVVAAPEFSVAPKQWCYPVIGCAAYRGFFDRNTAAGYGETLAAQGLDVAVLGAAAYSTLGWFDDPLPSTVSGWSEAQVAALIFHELAHQRLYVAGDSAFNEAFATVVANVGVERWYRAQGNLAAFERWRAHNDTMRRFTARVLETRAALSKVYASAGTGDEMRAAKRTEFERLRADLESGRLGDGMATSFASWAGGAPNNAHLASIATYHELEAPLEALLESLHGDLPRFYESAASLSTPSSASAEQRVR